MKKPYLKTLPPLEATVKMIEIAKEDKGTRKNYTNYRNDRKNYYFEYKHYLYFRAKLHGDILQIALFKREDLVHGDTKPRYYIYLDNKEKEFTTWDLVETKWRNAKIDMLCDFYRYEGYQTGSNPYIAKENLKIIQSFLKQKDDAFASIRSFQLAVRREKLKQIYRRETDGIDAVMNQVPELPNNFKLWADKEGFYNRRYIFYTSEKTIKSGWCSHCHAQIDFKKRPYKNKEGICPNCKSKVVYKTFKGQKSIWDQNNVAIWQKLKNGEGYVIRRFSITKKYENSENFVPEIHSLFEVERIVYNKEMRGVRVFVYEEYKQSGQIRWCDGILAWEGASYSKSAVIYGRNIKSIRKEIEALKYVPLENIIASSKGKRLYLDEIIRECSDNKLAERLIKVGLYQLVSVISKYNLRTDDTKKKLWAVLQIKKEDFDLAVKNNISVEMLRIMQKEKEVGVRMTWPEKECVCLVYGNHGSNKLIKEMVHATPYKVLNYLCKIEEKSRELKSKDIAIDYVDYLINARKLGMPMNKAVMFPSDFKEAHDRSTYEVLAMENKIHKMKRKEQDSMLTKLSIEIEEKYSYEDKDYKIIIPKNYEELKTEGNNQHHCVATYYERILKRTCVVIFIRKKDDVEKSYITVEMKEMALIQKRVKYGREVDAQGDKFIEKWLKEINKRANRKADRELIRLVAI